MSPVGGPGPLPPGGLRGPIDIPSPDTEETREAPASLLANPLGDDPAIRKAIREIGEAYGDIVAELRKHPGLPAVLDDLLPADLKGEDLMLWATGLFNDAMEKLGKSSAEEIRMRMDQMDKVNAANLQKLMEAQKKAADAEPGFWGKLLGWVSKAFTAVLSVAAVGVALLALGAYMATSLVMEAVNEARVAKGLEPIDWNPIGKLAGAIAKLAGADEETVKLVKAIANVVTDLVVSVAATVMLPGAGLALIAARGAKTVKNVQDLIKLGDQLVKAKSTFNKVKYSMNTVEATTGAVKAGMAINTAVIKGEATDLRAEMKELMALLNRLQGLFDDLVQEVGRHSEQMKEATSRAADSVTQAGEVREQIAGNLGAMA